MKASELTTDGNGLTQTEIDAIKAERQTVTPATDNGAGQMATTDTTTQPTFTVELTTWQGNALKLEVAYYDIHATDVRYLVDYALKLGWTKAMICLYSTELEILSKCKTFTPRSKERIFALIDKILTSQPTERKRGRKHSKIVG